METRDLYKQKYAAQIHEWSARLETIEARAEQLSVRAKLEMKPRLDAIRARLELAKRKVHDVATASDDKWDAVKNNVEHAWSETTAAIEGAYDAVMEIANEGRAPAKTPTQPEPAASKPDARGSKELQEKRARPA